MYTSDHKALLRGNFKMRLNWKNQYYKDFNKLKIYLNI